MDYFCAKFGDFCLSRFSFIVQTDRHIDEDIHRESHSQRRNDRYRRRQ